MLPETDAEHDREGDQRHNAGKRELAWDSEGGRGRDDAEGHVAHQVREQQEYEGGESPRQISLAVRADAYIDHVVDEADQAFDSDLPAAGDKLPLHTAEHEQPDGRQDDERPQGAVRE